MKPEDVKPGMRVVHTVFGLGEVLSIRYTDHREVFGPEASIKFDRYGIKGLVLTFASPKMEPESPAAAEDPPGFAALRDVIAERKRQDAKWGEQNHDPQIYLSILMEEVGEAAKEANDARWPKYNPSDPDEVRKMHLERFRTEMVQTAAVALAIVECLDRGKWQWPAEAKP